MKFFNKIFYIVLFISSLSLQAQENLPFLLSNIDPIAHHLVWTEDFPQDSQHYDILFEPLIEGPYIYMMYHRSESQHGFKVEKYNMETGERLWVLDEFTKLAMDRRSVTQGRIEGDFLVLTLLEENNNIFFRSVSFWREGFVGEWRVNKYTGAVEETYMSDKQDSLNFSALAPTSVFFRAIYQMQFFYHDSLYRHVSDIQRDSAILLYTRYINRQGHLEKIQSVDLTCRYPLFSNRLLLNRDGNLVTMVSGQDEATGDISIMYRLLNPDFEVLVEKDLATHLDKGFYSMYGHSVDQDVFIVYASYVSEEENLFHRTYSFFDREGEFLDKVVTITPIEPKPKIFTHYPLWDRVHRKGMVIHTEQTKNRQSSKVQFYQSRGETAQLIKELEVSGFTDHLRVMYATMTPSGNVAIYWRQFLYENRLNDNLPFTPYWYSWMLLSGEDLNIISSSQDTGVAEALDIYPNPAHNEVWIKCGDHPAEVEIYTSYGLLMHRQKVTASTTVDISGWPAGTYIAKVSGARQNETHTFVKVE